MKKGIVLVANLKSQWYCENLIFSIRKSGCKLPIRLVHFGGEKINSEFVLSEVEYLTYDEFSNEAKAFITNLGTVLTDCPKGFLYRFLGWFSDWDEFIYADNDIVALMNWEQLFEYTEEYDLVHADEEYTTQGIFNYMQPDKVEAFFGEGSLNTAITAGHIVVKKNPKMIADMNAAIEWFKQHPEIPKKHDQSLLHIATLIGDWKLLNLCKQPHNWLSSWSGDYTNSLDLIQAIQGGYVQDTASHKTWFSIVSDKSKTERKEQSPTSSSYTPISHLHYSGRGRIGSEPIDDLMFSDQTNKKRMKRLFTIQLTDMLGITYYKNQKNRVKNYLNRILK